MLLADGNVITNSKTQIFSVIPVATETSPVVVVIPYLPPQVKGSIMGLSGVWVLLILTVIAIGIYFIGKKFVKKTK